MAAQIGCACERAASRPTLRNLNTYKRHSMTQEQLSGSALLATHDDTKICLDEVVDLFAQKQPRKLEINSVLIQDQMSVVKYYSSDD